MDRRVHLIVLFSGEGSNLENLIDRFHGRRIGDLAIEVIAITNRPAAGGILRARRHGIEPIVIDHSLYRSREAFDETLVETIERFRPHFVVMAGFMRILTPRFTSAVEAINLHPSLLPLFKGGNAIEESLRSGMKVGGVTIHRVTAELDSGEILAQRCVPIDENDTLESFTQKIRKVEHALLPETVEKLIRKKYLDSID